MVSFMLSTTLALSQADDAESWCKDLLDNYGLSAKESKNDLTKYDISPLLTHADQNDVYGIIGANFRRIQVNLSSVTKSKTNTNEYIVTGATKVSDNVNKFSGSIALRTARYYEPNRFDMPYNSPISPDTTGVAFFDYLFNESRTDDHSGFFKGILAVSFHIIDGKIKNNDLRHGADEFTNNEYVGTWTSYSSGNKLVCNWGDYRVPNIIGFDCGAGEFAPCEKYLNMVGPITSLPRSGGRNKTPPTRGFHE